MSAPLEAVLFDLDGTLLDSIGLIVASFEHTMVAAELPHRTRAEILAELGYGEEAISKLVGDGAIGTLGE